MLFVCFHLLSFSLLFLSFFLPFPLFRHFHFISFIYFLLFLSPCLLKYIDYFLCRTTFYFHHFFFLLVQFFFAYLQLLRFLSLTEQKGEQHMDTVTTLARSRNFNISKPIKLTENVAGHNTCATAFCTASRRNVSRGMAQLRAEWRIKLHVKRPVLSNLRLSQH